MCAEQQLYLRITLFDFLNIFFLLRHAAAQSNNHIRALLFQMTERTDVAEGAILRMFTHCTGIIQDEIGFIDLFCQFIPHFVQHTADPFGIRLILLAAERMRIGTQMPPADQLRNGIHIGKLILQFFLRNNS